MRDVTDYYQYLAEGKGGTKRRLFRKFGRNSAITQATDPEDITEIGGLYAGQPAAGTVELVEVLSASAADTAAGTGARTVRIYGLDANYEEQNETIILAGTTPVDSVNTYVRVFSMNVETAGSGGSNAGILTARHTTTTANVFAGVPVGANQSQIAAYTVPAGHTLYVHNVYCKMSRSNGSNAAATFSFKCRALGEVYRKKVIADITTGEGFLMAGKAASLKFEEKNDILASIDFVSDDTVTVSCEFSGVLVKNPV